MGDSEKYIYQMWQENIKITAACDGEADLDVNKMIMIIRNQREDNYMSFILNQ